VTCSRQGFTLPEVCVALTIFLVGTTALLGSWNFFNREVADERMRLDEFYDVLETMESLVANRPNCDSSSVSVRLTRVPGSLHLAWAVVASEHYSLKRFVRCR
jgi:prepilin-type N-terminal cleavage/methylation domain-containing protein